LPREPGAEFPTRTNCPKKSAEEGLILRRAPPNYAYNAAILEGVVGSRRPLNLITFE
jgi:hypothetical protein